MILLPSKGPGDWKALLADPELHWRKGYSASSLAHCWENSSGFPPSVSKTLENSGYPGLSELDLLLAIPEFKVSLPGGRAASQNDIFVLARGQAGLVTIMVEGKVSETFGPLVREWYAEKTPSRTKRLEYLCGLLRLDISEVMPVRYQLLHRTASALITAERFTSPIAVILVHSFSQSNEWFDDFAQFASLYEINAKLESAHYVGDFNGVELYLAWAKGNKRWADCG